MSEKEIEKIEEVKDVETLDEEGETEIDLKKETKKVPVGFIILFSVLTLAIIATIIVLFALGGPLSKEELDVITSSASV